MDDTTRNILAEQREQSYDSVDRCRCGEFPEVIGHTMWRWGPEDVYRTNEDDENVCASYPRCCPGQDVPHVSDFDGPYADGYDG